MLLTPLSIAHWVVQNDQFLDGTSKLCTDNFTKKEVLLLINILSEKHDIVATINNRVKENNEVRWQIGISILSMPNSIILVKHYITPEMLYKLRKEK